MRHLRSLAGSGANLCGGAARSEEEDRLCGENWIPDRWDSLVFQMETPLDELAFANTAGQFNSSQGGCCAIKVLEAEHRSSPRSDTAEILFDQIVKVSR